MKKGHWYFFLFLLWTSVGFSQGTVQFTLSGSQVVPSNSSTTLGFGTAELIGNSLTITVEFDESLTPTSGFVHRGALGQNGPQLLDLGSPFYAAPVPGSGMPGSWVNSPPSFALSPTQVAEFGQGLMYVNISSMAFPNGEIRGQLSPVPEPSTWIMFAAGAVIIYWRSSKKSVSGSRDVIG